MVDRSDEILSKLGELHGDVQAVAATQVHHGGQLDKAVDDIGNLRERAASTETDIEQIKNAAKDAGTESGGKAGRNHGAGWGAGAGALLMLLKEALAKMTSGS